MAQSSAITRRRAPRKGDLTEQRLIRGAEALLAARPLASIGVDEIASAAGISRSSFYFYFGSREALLRALGERAQDEVFGSAERWLNRTDERPADVIRLALADNLALWRKRGPILRALYDMRNGDPESAALWRSIARRYVDATAAQIEREREAGLAYPAPPDARQLAAALTGMNLRAFYDASQRSPSPQGDRELVQTLATVWIRTVYRPT